MLPVVRTRRRGLPMQESEAATFAGSVADVTRAALGAGPFQGVLLQPSSPAEPQRFPWIFAEDGLFSRNEVRLLISPVNPTRTHVRVEYQLRLKPLFVIAALLAFVSFCGWFVFLPMSILRLIAVSQQRDHFRRDFWSHLRSQLGEPSIA
jgi:hypothetical protein